MTAKVISLCDYRKSRDAEKRSKSVRGLGFPDFGWASNRSFPFTFTFREPLVDLNYKEEEEE